MNTTRVVRRRGKPNRGGGRFNRGSGRGRGSGGPGPGHVQKKFSDADEFDDVTVDVLRKEDDRASYQRQGRGSYRGSDRPRRRDVRVKLQTLHMSEENQDMVRDMLRDLHGEEPEFQSEDEYDELDMRTEEQYWVTRNTMHVEEALAFGHRKEGEVTALDHVSRIAVNKLARYGYEKKRCIEALQLCDSDIGSALEYLFNQCFNTGDKNSENTKKSVQEVLTDNDITWEYINEQRNDEMMALKSIYEEKVEEKIPNKVWSVKFDLPVLKELVKPFQQEEVVMTKNYEDEDICKFYMKGCCHFGRRCRYAHVIPEAEKPNIPSGADQVEPDDRPDFELEVRFPKDNLYPIEAPIIGFSSIISDFPPHICLNITDRLLQEARENASCHAPTVFSLISLLDDEMTVTELYTREPMEFSLPEMHKSWRKQKQQEQDFELPPSILEHVENNDNDLTAETEAMIRMVEKEEEMAKMAEEEKVEIKRANSKEAVTKKSTSPAEIIKQNKRLKEDYLRKKQSSNAFKNMISQRQKLPAWNMQEEILTALDENQVLVVSGMTGCGKTTQVPQFILDMYMNSKDLKMCNILCTQPRRISAISVAERVADERAEKLGRTVGYQIRLEKVQSPLTRLLFCTTGIVLRTLEGDPSLEGITHIIIDEVHERSEESDFLMMYLRDMLPKRPDLKVILMSATLNAELFSSYFGGCPVIDIPGKTFPVEQFFLEDVIEFTRFVMDESSPYARPIKITSAVRKDSHINVNEYDDERIEASKPPNEKTKDEKLTVKQLIYRYSDYHKSTCKALSVMDLNKINYELLVALLEWIVEVEDEQFPQGAILVFLPGFAEIQTLYDMLHTNPIFGSRNKSKFRIIPLHSSLSSEDQHAVFLKPPDGVTKIVIATNIAETSITIDDIVYVVDAGQMKEKRYDSTKGMESLETVWVSRANALQRRGRAGRVTNGICFHLFTSHKFKHYLKEQPIPEIQRAPLEQIVLRIKMLSIFKTVHAQEVLDKLPEPPEDESTKAAIKRLQDLGALDEMDELTPLGYHLGSLPVDVRVGKLILFGAIFRCLDPALTIAASLSFKTPFVSPFDKRDEANKKKLEFATGNSDHLTMATAYKGWLDARKRSSYSAYCFCRDNFLSVRSLEMLANMKQQFVELLSDIGFVKEGIGVRDVERAGRGGADGVLEITGTEANVNSSNLKLVAAILVGALYPNVVQVLTPESKYHQSSTGALPKLPKADELKFKTKGDGYVNIHPSSVNFQVGYFESPYLVYHEKVKTSKVYIRDATMVSVYPLLLFGGGSINVDLEKGNFILSVDDGWIRFMATSHQVAELMRELRMELDQLLSDKIENPHMDLCTCPKGSKIIDTIVKLITTQ